MMQLRKKVLSFSLSLVLLLGSIPSSVLAAQLSATETNIKAAAANAAAQTVEQQVLAHAKSINKSGADDDAGWALAKHGITGGGKQLTMGSSHGMTATLMNSKLGLAAVTLGCTMAVETMQQTCRDYLYVGGNCNWNSQGMTYQVRAYPNEENKNSYYLLRSAPKTEFTDKTNSYDESLVWMSGLTAVRMYFTRGKVTADTVTYSVTVVFKDRFDFNTGSHTTPEKFASVLGSALFREFDWIATTKFQLTVPNSCTHQTKNYHLTYDPQQQILLSDASDGFAYNEPEQKLYSTATTYYQMERSICLEHDRPWVLEYTVTKANKIAFSEAETKSRRFPYILNDNRKRVFIVLHHQDEAGDTYAGYYGIVLGDYFKYNSKDSYTIRLENRPYDDGSNMIFLQVHNDSEQQTVLEPTAMDDYYLYESSAYVLQDNESKALSGQDLKISYIGNRSYKFAPPAFEMKVWENGENAETESCFDAQTVLSTCTAKGYTLHTCRMCGYAYKDQSVSALGHTFGAWEQTKQPGCTTAGELRRICSRCNQYETELINALGHGEVADEGKAPSCTEAGLTEGSHCETCGDVLVKQEKLDALGHEMSPWITLKEMTCTEDGQRQRACSRCDYSETETIPMTGHTVLVEESKAPTCTETGLTEGSFCATCGEVFAKQALLPALGHEMSQWTILRQATCTRDGQKQRTCHRCHASETEIIPMTGHAVVVDESEAPTCTQSGLTEGTHCATCGKVLVNQQVVAAPGHDMGAWNTLREMTCTQDGQKRRDCSRCDFFETETVPMSGHREVYDEAKAPTCTETGLTEGKHCATCDEVLLKQEVLPVLGHTYKKC